jgi:hypothetical protein
MFWFEGAYRTGWLVLLWIGSAVALAAIFWFWTRGVTPSRRMTQPWRPRRLFHWRNPRDPRPSV